MNVGTVFAPTGAANTGALSLSGSDAVELGDNFDIGTGEFTIEFWFIRLKRIFFLRAEK